MLSFDFDWHGLRHIDVTGYLVTWRNRLQPGIIRGANIDTIFTSCVDGTTMRQIDQIGRQALDGRQAMCGRVETRQRMRPIV
jgi:hypothetical protein